ncbi:hypothetical protein M413DRAFT_444966 [Hebeloma cylindrosporum]|uniref:Uncharacterized protein n=1 Tax=Hebeloma cylindrosporum TaxID=76867 RepID=A0A0C3CDQ2_HEBCY|nr:hypothetical protein M413DRAFT_444966 [Hebeloma cylindrosporum h7]
MDYTKLKQERIASTKIAPYDMITAVTQRAINKQFEKIHKVNDTLQTLSILSADPEDTYSRLDADLNPPTIELRLGTENRIVIFCLNIKQATLKYLKIKGMKVVMETVEIPSCVLALSVDLTFETVAFSKLPKEVQARLKVMNNYSVQQLLVDFTSTSLARMDDLKTTVQDHIEDLSAKASFNNFISKYFIQLGTRKDDFVLHYVPLATEEGRKKFAMPTIPPIDLTFQNMPFVLSASDKGQPSDDNMLVYLQITGDPTKRTLPHELLPISANWVVPTPDNTDRYDGTVALSKEIFLDGWLLPKLASFNKDSTWIVNNCWWKTDGPYTTVYSLTGQLGLDGASADDLKWVTVEAKDVDQTAKNKVKGSGQWYKYYHYSHKDDNKEPWCIWQNGTTRNWLFIPEGYNDQGKCEIFISGSTFVEFYVKVNSPVQTGQVNAEWSTSLVLDGVNDGELIIKAADINPIITSKVNQEWLSHFTEPCETGLKKLSMTHILNEMRSVFQNGWDFVLPGGGDFYINKAVFNREKDLLCELKYKFKA